MTKKYSEVNIRVPKQLKLVQIGSDQKPRIIEALADKWQSLLNTVATITKVSAVLIKRLNEKNFEVFVVSSTSNNIYKVGQKESLNHGLFCETVAGLQEKLLVPDASADKFWKEDNPDVDNSMISYLGFPILWPDGEVFGTICLLDNKENHFSEEYVTMLEHMKQHLESDLQLLLLNDELNKKNRQLEQLNASKSRFISLISHDVRGDIGIIDEFLKLLTENMDSYEPDKIKSIMEALSQSAGSAYLTLDNLLNWSKNEMAGLNADKIKLDVIQLIDGLIDYFRQAIAMKKLVIEKDYYAKKAFVVADENMLNVSFRNILSNAIKYNPEGGRIIIKVNPSGTQHSIEFEDTGIGMDSNTLNHLFTYNKSHRKYGTSGEKSAGVGLILAKEFLDKNNAKVEVESELNKGTKFKVTV